jgi:hypothetical protein
VLCRDARCRQRIPEGREGALDFAGIARTFGRPCPIGPEAASVRSCPAVAARCESSNPE